MQLATELRDKIIDDVKDAILASASKVIKFLDDTGTVLCSVAFDSMADGDADASYTFTNAGNINLIGSASTGTVASFSIDGYIGEEIVSMISGSVGFTTSGADIEFNRLEWSNGDIIRLSNLALVMPQGD